MDPNVRLGPLTLAWHGIFTAVGIFFGVWLPVRLLRGIVSEDDAYSVATWGVISGIAGARLVHVVDQWAFYSQEPLKILQIWVGGIAIWGAVLGGILGGTVIAIRRGIPIARTADAAAPGLGLGLAIGRIGDIINGEHHATACEGLPWCVGYSFPPALGGLGQPGPVHPAVVYEMVLVLGLVFLALKLRERAPGRVPHGFAFWTFLLGYGVTRFAVSFLRIGEPVSLLSLRQDQLIGVATALVAIPALLWLVLRPRRSQART